MSNSILDGNIGSSAVFNHEVITLTDGFMSSLNKFNNDQKFYEVIRCIDGVPLFLNDHLKRLKNSSSSSVDFSDSFEKKIISDINFLIKQENMKNGNIKIVLTPNTLIIFPSTFYYPEAKVYETGVNVGLLKRVRTNPNVKIINEDYKREIAEKLNENGPYGKYFETLLVSDGEKITEGSRTNVFFLSGKSIVTAPDSAILKGITRKYIIQAIENAGLKIVYDFPLLSQIGKSLTSGFISGTSIGVLPIASVEDVYLNSGVHPDIMNIRNKYEKIVELYIKQKENK